MVHTTKCGTCPTGVSAYGIHEGIPVVLAVYLPILATQPTDRSRGYVWKTCYDSPTAIVPVIKGVLVTDPTINLLYGLLLKPMCWVH